MLIVVFGVGFFIFLLFCCFILSQKADDVMYIIEQSDTENQTEENEFGEI